MHLPNNMPFRYLFFDTYIGYILQIAPFALIAGVVYGMIRHKINRRSKLSQTILKSLFISYLTGLIGLVLLFDFVWNTWYLLVYHVNIYNFDKLFQFRFNFVPDFWKHINGESIGNFILFLPFGFLYPLANGNTSFKDVIKSGTFCVGAIEIIQPVFGRAFDINDIILNLIGLVISAAIFFRVKQALTRRQHN